MQLVQSVCVCLLVQDDRFTAVWKNHLENEENHGLPSGKAVRAAAQLMPVALMVHFFIFWAYLMNLLLHSKN